MKNTAIIAAGIGLVGSIGAAWLATRGNGGSVATGKPVPTGGTPVTSPATGTPLSSPAVSNQTGVTDIPLDQATSAVNAPGQKKHKHKHKK